MRVLIISDIHGNFEALSRIPEEFDRVLCMGDLVDYCPDASRCIAWMREHDAVVVRGNHDHAVAHDVDCRCGRSMAAAAEETRQRTRRVLDAADLDYLGSRPVSATVSLGAQRVYLTHAVPSDPLYTYLDASDIDRWRDEVVPLDPDIILVGHTHLPMLFPVGKKLILNPGSVGQPRDGDPRAAFAVIENGVPRLERVAYDIERAVARLAEWKLSEDSSAMLSALLLTGRSPGQQRSSPGRLG
jgi:putative phosphoesterase